MSAQKQDNGVVKQKSASYHITEQTKVDMAEVVNSSKQRALSKTHKVQPNDGWVAQKAQWQEADDTLRKSLIYGMVMHDGAVRITDITRFYGIKKDEVKPYSEVFEMAKAALKLKIQNNQITTGLIRDDQVNLKFHLGKQFAEQVQDPAHEGVAVAEGTGTGVKFNLNVQSVERDEHGNTIVTPTQSLLRGTTVQ